MHPQATVNLYRRGVAEPARTVTLECRRPGGLDLDIGEARELHRLLGDALAAVTGKTGS